MKQTNKQRRRRQKVSKSSIEEYARDEYVDECGIIL